MTKVGNSKAAGRAKPRQATGPGTALEDEVSEDDNQIVHALARGLDVLDAFRRSDVSLGNTELADRTGLTRSTVSRLAYTLMRQGYISFDAKHREYRLGVKAITLGSTALAMTNVRSMALPLMREFAAGGHFNVGLGTRDGYQMVYTDACEGDALIGLRLYPGSRIPITTSAMGRAYLASIEEKERAVLLQDLRSRHDESWSSILRGVEEALFDYEHSGFCFSIGDWQKDINGVAVPIRPMLGQPTYVLNLGGPAYMLPEVHLREKLGPRLREIALSVEQLLGVSEPKEPVTVGAKASGKR